MSEEEKNKEEEIEESKPKLEHVSVEVNEHHHLAYLGQQINQINGQMAKLNENVRVFGFLHKDLDKMNNHMYWIALSFKISIISAILGALLFGLLLVLL
tara:strand:+ start:775 stop:1071 length:297 start_codon:yes stop_codon:yes gene_type:complete